MPRGRRRRSRRDLSSRTTARCTRRRPCREDRRSWSRRERLRACASEGRESYYSRRHLIKPGLTGWAQVRCGYAGSDTGSAWKLCHDLCHLKHRSFALDLAILLETFRSLLADRQFPALLLFPWVM
ncbi:MAG: sugar transferase [Solirubrobacteraceae bacterium]